MTKTTAISAVLGIALAAGYVATQDGPTCVLETVFMPCADAHTLGSDIACEGTETVGIVTAARIVELDPGPHEPMPPDWLPVAPEALSPVACADYSFPSDAPADRVQVIPTVERYPECWVGEVERLAQGGEFPTPAEPPHVGVCCAPGCKSAGLSEAIAPGGPKFYECGRLHKMFPDAPCGD